MSDGIFARVYEKMVNVLGKKSDDVTEAYNVYNEIISREAWHGTFQQNPLLKRVAESEIVNIIKKKKERSLEIKRYYFPQWNANAAFFAGNQWAVWSDTSGVMELPEDERTRLTINRARVISRNLIAKLTRNKPILHAIPPESGDPADRDAAQISELFLNYQLDRMSYREYLQDVLQWTHIEAKGYLMVVYDPNIGDVKKATVPVSKYARRKIVRVDENGEPVIGPDGEVEQIEGPPDLVFVGDWPADEKGNPIRFDDPDVNTPDDLSEEDLEKQFEYITGDIRLELVPLHEIFWEPGALSLDRSRWVIHSRRISMEELIDNPMFQNVEKVVPDTNPESRYETLVGVGNYTSSWNPTEHGSNSGQYVTIDTYYERRSPRHPNGLMIVIAGNVLLYKGELPVGEIPLVEFKELNEPNRFVPVALMEQLAHPQIAYNMARSQELEYVKQAIIGSWMYRENSLDDPPIGFAGEHIKYRGSDKPERVPTPPLPSAVFQAAESDKTDIAEIAGLYEASRGIAATNITSGLHAKLLIEADESKLGPMTDIIEMATEKLGNLVLMYARKFFVNERIMRIVGENRDVQIIAFKGSDLKADVKVVQGSARSESLILKKEEIFVKWQAGWYGNPFDENVRRYAHKAMGEGFDSPQNMIIQHNVLQAKRENMAASKGEDIPPVNEWDDHVAHDNEHSEWLVSADGIKAGREMQELMWAHIQQHRRLRDQMFNPGANTGNAAAQIPGPVQSNITRLSG